MMTFLETLARFRNKTPVACVHLKLNQRKNVWRSINFAAYTPFAKDLDMIDIIWIIFFFKILWQGWEDFRSKKENFEFLHIEILCLWCILCNISCIIYTMKFMLKFLKVLVLRRNRVIVESPETVVVCPLQVSIFMMVK